MGTKFFKASPFYEQYLNSFYSLQPQLSSKSYSQQYDLLISDLFGWSNFWKLNLEKFHGFNCEEVILNNKPMQIQWAKENNFAYSEENWLLDILEQQLIKFQPEIFFAHDYGYITPAFLKKIKRNVPSIKLVIGWDGLWYNDLELYKEHDIVLSCIEECADFYSANGKRGFHFPFGFEKTISNRLDASLEKSIDTSFIGSLTSGNGKHSERFKTISYIASKTNFSLFANGLSSHHASWNPLSRPQLKTLLNGNFGEWYNTWRLGSSNKGPLFGLAMYQKLAESKISLNIHIDAAKDKAVNMRLLEVTGVGSCLLTDHKSNIADYFVPDKEIVTFKSKVEAVEKIKWLLANEEKLNAIAKAGQQRTMENYSLEKRIANFISFLHNN